MIVCSLISSTDYTLDKFAQSWKMFWIINNVTYCALDFPFLLDFWKACRYTLSIVNLSGLITSVAVIGLLKVSWTIVKGSCVSYRTFWSLNSCKA